MSTDSVSIVDTSNPVSSLSLVLGAYIGYAVPVHYAPVLPNQVGGDVGLSFGNGFVLSADVTAAATSAVLRQEYPNAANLTHYFLGISVHWFGLSDLFVSVSPSYHRTNYYQSIPMYDDRYLESRNAFTVGFGAGVRLSDLVVFEIKHYPVLDPQQMPLSKMQERSTTMLRAGVMIGDI
jgi:hypothetical protein